MRVKEIYKTMIEEDLRTPVRTLNNRQLKALLKKDKVEMSRDTDYLVYSGGDKSTEKAPIKNSKRIK